jgi:hypothetical protein
MRRIASLALGAAVLLTAFSCNRKNTQIAGVLEQGGNQPLTVKLLDVNRFQTLDTLKLGDDGQFTYALDLQENQPEFIYLFYGEKPVASMLLQKGDQVTVGTDTLGNCRIEGSPESLELQENDRCYNAFIRDMEDILAREENPDAALSRRFVAYYRDRVAYVMGHTKSLAVVPVLFQQVNPTLPVFGQASDGLLLRMVCDSLQTVYPESRFVKALDNEAKRRVNQMQMQERIRSAQEVGFVDIDLPGIDGKNVKLSEVVERSKVVMVYFWASTAEQKMFNLDAIAPLYEEFHPQGFEVYAVSMDADKAAWAATVRGQHSPWVNVCDIRGVDSPYVVSYGLGTLPMVWFIVDGEVTPVADIKAAADIRTFLKKNL